MDKSLLKILACPVCKSQVALNDNTITCSDCKRTYPIKNDIPIMLAEEARINEKKE